MRYQYFSKDITLLSRFDPKDVPRRLSNILPQFYDFSSLQTDELIDHYNERGFSLTVLVRNVTDQLEHELNDFIYSLIPEPVQNLVL